VGSERRKERKGECGVVPTILMDVAAEKEKRGGPVWGTPHDGRSWGREWGTGAAVWRRGVTDSGPEPTCVGGRRAPAHNRGGRMAAMGTPPRPGSRASAVKFYLKLNSNCF
jgi:hypothetical protein